jgi:hypothetical protein
VGLDLHSVGCAWSLDRRARALADAVALPAHPPGALARGARIFGPDACRDARPFTPASARRRAAWSAVAAERDAGVPRRAARRVDGGTAARRTHLQLRFRDPRSSVGVLMPLLLLQSGHDMPQTY